MVRDDSSLSQQDYLQEAGRIRGLAENIKDPQVRRQLIVIASLYEKLAKHVGGRTDGSSDDLP